MKTKIRDIIIAAIITIAFGALVIGGILYSEGISQVDVLPLKNVVQIRVECDYSEEYYENAGWQGSGVFIADDLILTAGHIVDKAGKIEIVKPDGTIHKAVDWYLETDADIGFIRVKTKDKEKKLRFDKATLGEDAWVYGNPLGVFPVLSKGIISAVNMPDDYTFTKRMLITDAGANPGNSGGPLFDKDGNILGICSWHYPYAEGMNYFVRSEIIKLSLNKYRAILALKESR